MCTCMYFTHLYKQKGREYSKGDIHWPLESDHRRQKCCCQSPIFIIQIFKMLKLKDWMEIGYSELFFFSEFCCMKHELQVALSAWWRRIPFTYLRTTAKVDDLDRDGLGAKILFYFFLNPTVADPILNLERVILFKPKHPVSNSEMRFSWLLPALLCLVITIHCLPPCGLDYRWTEVWSPLPTVSFWNPDGRVMIVLLCQTFGQYIIKSYFSGTVIKGR